MKPYLFFFTLLQSMAATAQHAEELFKQRYARIGLELGSYKYFTQNTPNPNLFAWTPVHSGNIGLVYNIRQYKNLNLKVAALYSLWEQRSQISHSLMSGSFTRATSSSGPYAFLLFPLDVEYYFKSGRRLYVAPMAGFEITINPYGSDEGGSRHWYRTAGYQSSTTVYEYASDIPVYAGLRLGISANLATRALLLKMAAVYSHPLRDYLYEGDAVTEVNGVRSTSKHRMPGHYLGIGLSIVPNKRFFK